MTAPTSLALTPMARSTAVDRRPRATPHALLLVVSTACLRLSGQDASAFVPPPCRGTYPSRFPRIVLARAQEQTTARAS
eukprot:CAMPEP_0197438630 /NCGR_PEP_ID=MMETSP1175-20131217/5558_1 /TAXON_ID=1003142 /ORGANISM="Triceratium dubium, Strain CCMP147" /LENGTH=78 /DNA_ID=CAMNT_0042968387 /DNA_START=27 /DNA_END=260 /DNA_ORIENTATION=+